MSTRLADPLAHLPHGPERAARAVVNIYGASSMGKTTLAAEMYARAVERGISCTWVDTTGKNAYLARLGGDDVVRAHVATLEGWLAYVRRAALEGRRFNIVFDRRKYFAELRDLWSLVLELGNMLLAVDEMDTYAPARAQLERHPLGMLISQGRLSQVSMISTVRTPPELHGMAKGSADVSISFRQPRTDYARTIATDVMGEAPRSVATLLTKLPRFTALEYHSETGRLYRRQVNKPRQ